ncbi:MAG: ankyrin repeat domain-containing protein [Parachlamydiaceae bacterium]|nr:ankyrin repeat domain-containing protein [Parachlamydiaceae bacterium]
MIHQSQPALLIDANAIDTYFNKPEADQKKFRLITYKENNTAHIKLISKENLSFIETIKGWFGTSEASMSNVARACLHIPNLSPSHLKAIEDSVDKYNSSHWWGKQVPLEVQFSIEYKLLITRSEDKSVENQFHIQQSEDQAIIRERVEILNSLAQKAPKINDPNKEAFQSLFRSAVSFNCNLIIEKLLEMYPEILSQDQKGLELLLAAQNSCNRVVKSLIERGADGNFKDPKSGVTPLIHASRNGDLETVKALLSYPDIKLEEVCPTEEREGRFYETKDRTALYHAFKSGNSTVAEELLKKGADVKAILIEEDSLLNIAMNPKTSPEMFNLLLKYHDNVFYNV